jgi:hypothetical protein
MAASGSNRRRGSRLVSAAALAAAFVLGAAAIPAGAASGGPRAHALFAACRAYGAGKMPLARFVDAVERFDQMTYPRLRFWLLLCGGT